MDAPNGDRPDITSGYSVAIVRGTYKMCKATDRKAFNDAVHMMTVEFPFATGIGTWVDGDDIHIDPVMVADDEDIARTVAEGNAQLAYYNLDTNEEVRLS
jgi:hypothetical protein